MQKGTVIEGEVLHRDSDVESDGGAKLFGGFSGRDLKTAHSNSAKNPAQENGHFAAEDNSTAEDNAVGNRPLASRTAESGEGNRHERLRHTISVSDFHSKDVLLEGSIIKAVLDETASSHPSDQRPRSPRPFAGSHRVRRGQRIGTFMSRVFTAMLAAVMVVSLGSFAGAAFDVDGVLGARGQSAYAAAGRADGGTTPYTETDVSLAVNAGGAGSDNADNSDNAIPDRVEADGEAGDGKAQEAGILGPCLPSAPGRASEDGVKSDASGGDAGIDAYIEGPYTYERIKDESGEYMGKVRLVKVDPAVGKVARIEANVQEIASGAFTECPELATLIVFGDIKSIAKAEYDNDGNITYQGAFTDDQIKNVHVVFATTYIDERTSLHETKSANSNADSNVGADADKTAEAGSADGTANAVGDNAGSGNEGGMNDAGESATPVEEGIKRLSGDVVLSALNIKGNGQDIWDQIGFENIVDDAKVGATNVSEDSDNLIYILNPNYTLNASWTSDSEMSSGLTVPRYGKIGDTVYFVNNMSGLNPVHDGFQDSDSSSSLSTRSSFANSKTFEFIFKHDWGGYYEPDYSDMDINRIVSGFADDLIHESTWAHPQDITYSYVIDEILNRLIVKVKITIPANYYLLLNDETHYHDTDEVGSGYTSDGWECTLNISNYKEYDKTHYFYDNYYYDKPAIKNTIFYQGEYCYLTPYKSDSFSFLTTYASYHIESFSTHCLNSSSWYEGFLREITSSPVENALKFQFTNYSDVIAERTYNYGEAFGTLPHPPIDTDGKYFAGWFYQGHKITSESTVPYLNASDSSYTIYAQWSDTPVTANYTVRHNFQTTSGGSSYAQNVASYPNQTLSGDIDADTEAKAHSVTGFTAKSIVQKKIKSDGSTVVDIYYDRNPHNVTLLKGTGISSVSGGGTKNYGTSVSVSASPSTGYHFVNWTGTYTSSSNPYAFNMPDSNVTLTANGAANTYTVTYNSNKPSNATSNVTGSTASSSHTYDSNKALTSNGFSLTGWRFNGWNTAANGSGTNYSNGQSVKNLTSANGGTVTLYAKWVANTYIVTYNANKPGGASSNVTGSTASSSHTYDTAKALTSNGYSLTGWRFNGWNTAANGSGTSYSNGQSVKSLTATHNGTVTLYAKWVAKTYTVTYNKNKPSNASHDVSGTTANSSHTYDTSKALTSNGYSLTGWTFKGWNTAANGTGTSYSNGQSVKNLTATHGATFTLYAQWTANTYYVSYSPNFMQSAYPNSKLLYSGMPSTNTMPLTTHTYDTARELSANLYGVTGYDFDGWATSPTGNAAYSNRQSVKNLTAAHGETVVIYAKWLLHTYYIDIRTQGGMMSAPPTTYNINSAAISIGNPYRTGYDFYGWSVTGAGEHGRSPILNTDPAQIPTGTYGNLVFTASWGAIQYRVQYNFNGGTGNAIGAQNATYGQPFTVATGTGNITRDGYAFSGYWNTFPDGSGSSYREGAQATNLTMLSGDTVVLYAVWNANRYALTLDAAGGTLPDAANWTPSADRTRSTRQVAFDTRIGTLLVPTRAGYGFAGWYNAAGEQVTSADTYGQASDMTLTARWTPYVYSVYFYKGAPAATGSMAALQLTYGTAQPLTPNAYSYTGHTFMGWARTQGASAPDFGDGESVSDLTTAENGVVPLYAVWSENHYSVNYHSNGAEVEEGKGDPSIQADIAYTERFYPPTASSLGFSMTGYTFAGWSDARDAEAGKYQPTDQVSSLTDLDGAAVNLWAVWTPIAYRLTLDATGGRFEPAIFQGVGQIWSPETDYVAAYRQVRYDEEHRCTIQPTRSGFDFAGWYTAPQSDPYVAGSGEGRAVSASDPYKSLEDTRIYAHWMPHTYTLNLAYYNTESMTETLLLSTQLRFNEPFTLPTASYEFTDPNLPNSFGKTLKDYQRTGFAVSGWSITRDGETNYQLGETVSGLDAVGDPDQPYTLYLTQAAGRYTVEFDPGVASGVIVDNLMLPQTWLYTDYVDVPWCTMTRQGYRFSHWTTREGEVFRPGYGQKLTQRAEIGETFVLTAHWSAQEITLRFMGTHREGVADRVVTYDSQITNVPTAESDRKCIFEGWWTKRDGSLDQCYFDWNGNINQGADAIYPYWRDPGNENGVVELWARWTFQVSYEFPYGGDDPSIHPSNFSAGIAYGDASNAMNFEPSYGLPTPKYNGNDSNKDNDGNVRRFAGWYDAAVGGNLITNDTLATGPVRPRPGADYEDVVLYARWYVDVTLDYPEYAPYSDPWAFEFGRDLTHTVNGRGQTVVSYVQGIPYSGDRSFALGLPRAERAGYTYLGWNLNGRGAIYDGETASFEGEIQSRENVTSERNYTIYLEYAKQRVPVTVRYWQQVIKGEDADGTPSTGLTPAIRSDHTGDVFTTNGHYKLVNADTCTVPLFTEDQIDPGRYHENVDVEDPRYKGFTYHATRISKDRNRGDALDPEALIAWNGATTPAQAGEDVYDGCVSGDAMSVVDVFYTRNKYDVSMHDFKITDGAGEVQVRGSAHVRGDSSDGLAYSPAEAAEMPGREQTLSAWFEEDVTLVGKSWPGYDFSGWDIEPRDLGYSKDVANEDPDVRLEGDVYTLTVTDSDLEVTPRCTARDDTEYHAILHYQNLLSATSVEEDRGAWATSLPIRLTGTTDALTGWVLRADAADADDVNVIEGRAVGTEDFNASGFPDDVAFDDAYVFDPHGFTGDSIVNPVVRADTDETLDVYYTRNAYSMDVLGYEATHRDGTPVGEEGLIEAYLWDNLKGGPAQMSGGGTVATSDGGEGYEAPSEAAAADASDADGAAGSDAADGADPNKASYEIYFSAPVSVVAVPHAGTELLGYTSSDTDIWNAKPLAEYAADIDVTLDANPLTDSAGLANTNPGNPYTFRYEGESAPHPMPIVPDSEDGTKGTLTLTIEGQPARTSYEAVVMLQDRGTETDPAYGTYTQYGQTRVFDTVAASDGSTRLLRYWADGTYVSANSDDENYVPAVEGFGLSAIYTPTLFGYETFDGRGIVDLTELTPEGNAGFHGTSSSPLNKAYVYMDRNARSLTYGYVVDGRYGDAVTLNEEAISTLPSSVGTYFGADVKVAEDPHANGWEFKGWTWAEDPDTEREDWPRVGEGTDSERVTIPDFDVEITGTWAPIEYGLTFDGGTAYEQSPATNIPAGMSVPFNSEWAVPDAEPARGGYTFVGWTFAERAVFEAIAGSAMDIPTGDADQCRATLAGLNDLDGDPLLLEPGQTQVWSWWKGDRTLHAVWMRDTYGISFDLAGGGWPTGTSVPLTYMTGDEVQIPQPVRDGYAFVGWDVACGGSTLEGDAPAVSYADDDPTRATINEWAYGDISLTARYEVRRFAVSLNPAGGTFDGEPEEFMGKDVDYSSPDGDGTYGQATVHIPFDTEITSATPLPEPERPGYGFAGWTDAEGNPVGWKLDDEGNRVDNDEPYIFDGAADTTWVATWRAHRYKVTYDFGEHQDSVTINDPDRFSEYYAGMADGNGDTVTSFMLPTADDLIGLPEGVGFDGWCPAGGNPDSDRMRSFDPNAETGNKEFTAVFSSGANEYTERFWLEVLDQSEDDPGRQYATIGGTRFALDETLSVTRRTNSPNAQASMSAISGFVSVNPYDESGVSIYPTEHPYVCVFSAGQNTVNGFYTREAHTLTVGTADGIDDGGTLIQVSPASALVRDSDSEGGAYEVDAAANTATLKGTSSATVKWGAGVNVGITCPRASGYAFTAWQTDSGTTPADMDVRSNPASFTMPDSDVALNPSTELVRFTAAYRDMFGKDVAGAGQTEFTVRDSFALRNLDGIAGYKFSGWEAYVADQDGNKLDPEANPVPGTVGYDDAHGYMRVRQGTASDLVFEARYATIGYTVSVTLPKGTSYLPSGMPDGLPQTGGIEWMLMPGDGADADAIGFGYTIEDLPEPLVVDLTGIRCAPYKVDRWTVAGRNGESSMPDLTDGILTLTKDDLGNWRLTPDVSPLEYSFTLDLSDVRDGYDPIDAETVKAELEEAGYKVEPVEGEKGKLNITFDVDSAKLYTLPSFGKADPDSTPEYAFRGWSKDGDVANASNPYILPPADIASWPETGTVIKPVWTKAGEQATLIAHLPNDEGTYTDDYTFTFTGDALTPIDYAQDKRFTDIVSDVDDANVGYHLVWHTDGGLTEESVTALPTNFPESGTQEVWGEWVEDDGIIAVGFGVKWDNSAPPGEAKQRPAFALNSADMAAAADDVAAHSGDADSDAVAFSARSTYAGDADSDAVAFSADEADGASDTAEAGTGASFYYIPNKGLYTKDANGKYHVVTRISNINEISGAYAGWRLEGFYLPIDTADPKRIIIGPDGTVDNAALVEVAGAKPSDLTFTVRWARISLVQIDMVGGYGDASEDLTLYYWPEKDVFVKGGDAAIGDSHSAPKGYARDDFNTSVMLGTFAARGIPESKEDTDGTRAFLGYFGQTSGRRWDYAKDSEGGPLPVVNALALTPSFSYLAVTGDYKKQAVIGADAIGLPYGYAETNADPESGEQASAYDPASADGTTHVTWRAAWEGDLDAVYFNATVPMSMSFMVKSDGTAIGPDAGAYQIRNYSNCPITVEDVSFAWADASELEALFGRGAADALALSATPTDGQEGYAQSKVLLERSKATQDAVGAALVSRHIFGADKWVIAKSVGEDPDDFAQAGGDISTLPTLRLDYGLTTGGIKQLTQENPGDGADTTHRIGTLRFTLKTAG